MIWCLILLCVIDAWGKGGYWHLESKVIISLVLAKSKGWISIQMLLLIGDSAKATYTVTCKVSGPSPFELWPSFAFSSLSKIGKTRCFRIKCHKNTDLMLLSS